MTYLLKIVEWACENGDKRVIGQYLKDCDFEAYEGQAFVKFTWDIKCAKQFDTFLDAMKYVHTVPNNKKWREDGKLNKPLTASTWEIVEQL